MVPEQPRARGRTGGARHHRPCPWWDRGATRQRSPMCGHPAFACNTPTVRGVSFTVGCDRHGDDAASNIRFAGPASNPHDRLATWHLCAAAHAPLATLQPAQEFASDGLFERRLGRFVESGFRPARAPGFAADDRGGGQGITGPRHETAALASRLIQHRFEQHPPAGCAAGRSPNCSGAPAGWRDGQRPVGDPPAGGRWQKPPVGPGTPGTHTCAVTVVLSAGRRSGAEPKGSQRP